MPCIAIGVSDGRLSALAVPVILFRVYESVGTLGVVRA